MEDPAAAAQVIGMVVVVSHRLHPIHLLSCGVLPEFTIEGELPPGVYIADWHEFQSRFGGSSLRRVWLLGRLRALLELAGSNGKLRRVFIWGSFVTAKTAPNDLDILLIMGEDFEVDGIAAQARDVFDSVRENDVHGRPCSSPGCGESYGLRHEPTPVSKRPDATFRACAGGRFRWPTPVAAFLRNGGDSCQHFLLSALDHSRMEWLGDAVEQVFHRR